jgi:hypothetical protein
MLYHVPVCGMEMLSTFEGAEVVMKSQVIRPFISCIFSILLCEKGAYLVIFPEPGNGTSGLGLVVVYGDEVDLAEINRYLAT